MPRTPFASWMEVSAVSSGASAALSWYRQMIALASPEQAVLCGVQHQMQVPVTVGCQAFQDVSWPAVKAGM